MKLPSFNKRPACSFLYVTELLAYQLDTDRAGRVLGQLAQFKVNCPSAAKLADTLKQISDNAKLARNPLGKKVWLLYDQLPMQLLSMPSMQIDGMEESTLIQALQFELEGLTGQSAMDMQIAYTLLNTADDMSHFWVSQLSALHFEDCTKALKQAGCQLQGLLHPAGLPNFVENTQQTDWLRLECWPRQLVALRHSETQGLNVQLFSYESRQWQTQLDKWLATHTPSEQSETFFTTDIQVLPDTQFRLLLKDDEDIVRWLALWAVALTEKSPPNVPILCYQSAVNENLLFMGGGAAIAVFICLAHLSWHLHQTNHFNDETKKLREVENALTSLNKSLSDSRDKKNKATEAVKKLQVEADSLPNLITNLQRRPSALLKALAYGRPENLLLEEIKVDKDSIVLHGITLDTTAANEFALFLEKQLLPLGWSVTAPSKSDVAAFAQGGPWDFEIKLLDLGLDGFKKKEEGETKL